MDLEDEAGRVVTRQDLVELVTRMASVSSSPEMLEWENNTLPRFLDGLAAWIAGMDGYFRNQGLEVPDQPSWRLVGDMLVAATLYE
ncbi:DUF7660 family protein [Micromonospora nigra]|uniref:DUF7660 family protein n=1 Tax=Micromonospora nigra TaxID=145857 RepID=UPI003CCBA6A1